MFSRLAKFSFAVFSFLVHLPFHILTLVYLLVAAVTCGAMSGFVMAVVLFHCGFPQELGWAWAFVVTPFVFATGVYRRFVRGEGSDE